MAAKYVLVATMDEGQIQELAYSAEEVLDLRDRFTKDPTCQELAMYRLVCVETVTSADKAAESASISYFRPRVPALYEVAG